MTDSNPQELCELIAPNSEIALVLVRAIPGPRFLTPLALGDGLYVVPHWRDVFDARSQARLRRFLGRDIRRSTLAIVATNKDSAVPLPMQADRLERALTLVVPGYSTESSVAIGAWFGTRGLDPQVSHVREAVRRTVGSPPAAQIAADDVRRAPAMADAITAMRALGKSPINRLARALHAYYRGLHSNVIDERLHQFVRVLDGIASTEAGKGRKQFRDRAATMLGLDVAQHGAFLQHAYDLRSDTEHLRGPLGQALKWIGHDRTVDDAYVELARVAFIFEETARQVLLTVLQNLPLAARLADFEDAQAFWASPESQACWGASFNIAARANAFDPMAAHRQIQTIR